MAKKKEAGPSHSAIAEAAYLRYLSHRGSHGSDIDDWVEAERELRSRSASHPKPQVPKPKPQGSRAPTKRKA